MFIAITHQRDHVFNPWTMDHDTVKMDPTITMAMARGCSWDLGHTARSAAHRGDGRCPPLPILVSEPDGDEARIHMPWIEHQHLKRLKMPVFFFPVQVRSLLRKNLSHHVITDMPLHGR